MRVPSCAWLLPIVVVSTVAGCGLGASLDEYTSGAAGGGASVGAGGAGASGGVVDASLDAKHDGLDGVEGGAFDVVADATPWPGAQCSAEGTYACAGSAQQVVLACEEGTWGHFLDCSGTKLCDSSLAPTVSDRCAEQVPICAGQTGGAYVCDGATLTQCGPDLVTATSVDCGSSQLCALHVGAKCAVCVDGEHQCSGAELRECAADHLSFTTKTTCANATLCNAGAGQCTSATCVPGQHRCTGAALELCNAAQTGFDAVTTCAAANLCDAQQGVCDVCVGGATSCADATHAQTCATDGSGWSSSACPASKPHCVGAGQCVECSSAADCAAPPDPCKVAVCSSGVCGAQVKSGASCDDGDACTTGEKCSAVGVCGGGTPKVCPAPDQCHSAGTCNPSTGACSNPVKSGAKCDDGDACTKGDTCSSSGACAGTAYSCTSPPDAMCQVSPGTCVGDGTCTYKAKADGTTCPGANVCHTYACAAGSCTDKGMKGNGTACGGGCDWCNAGNCVSKCQYPTTCKCGNLCLSSGQSCP